MAKFFECQVSVIHSDSNTADIIILDRDIVATDIPFLMPVKYKQIYKQIITPTCESSAAIEDTDELNLNVGDIVIAIFENTSKKLGDGYILGILP